MSQMIHANVHVGYLCGELFSLWERWENLKSYVNGLKIVKKGL